MPLTPQEEEFIAYWAKERLRRRRLFRQALISLPLGIIIAVSIFINFFSGWYGRAAMTANADPSVFIIIFIAAVLIVAFIAIFSSYHRWDINETRYKELVNKNST